MSNGERSRSVDGDDYAECPFMISYPTDPSAAARKRKGDSHDDKRFKLATYPFSQTGRPVTNNPMNIYYAVEPRKQWLDLKKFKSFLLNRVDYYVGHFVKVANKATVEQQKSRSNQETNYTKPGDYWVAYILEIRASDKHHIYILVYWMYWPDDLPSGARIDRKYVQGRQPYHGANELIATNHMEVINVASITEPVVVEQLIESNDEEPGANIDVREVQHLIDIGLKETRADGHTHVDVREPLLKSETSTPMLTSFKSKNPRIVHDIKKKGHKKKVAGRKPYVGLFEADLKTQCSPPVWEIRDLRRNGGANHDTWTEEVHCLLCGGLVM
ncbi:hypothetical protein FMUND_12397 [Fusarium mundagurra]|uniref:BAH domain-containing protein n=1 Tax=Fusarium mundagurra TaxID=1567541 RepID=A0A8H6D5T4_9HYPO|nr:hypothetical protein FMUND_12397 [Fusarium mundagurra]